jgi:PhoU domain/IstB-like ATP binding protein
MGGIAEKMLSDAMDALIEFDTALGQRAIDSDPRLDLLQRDVEEEAILAIARRQPLACDLREIIGTIRIAGDIERVGDLAKNIAKRAIKLHSEMHIPRATIGLKSMHESAAVEDEAALSMLLAYNLEVRVVGADPCCDHKLQFRRNCIEFPPELFFPRTSLTTRRILGLERHQRHRFLLRLAELELIDRETRMVERRIRAARFPAVKSFDTFDFGAIPSLNKPLTLELARCEYVVARENIIALGNSGTGKTHAGSDRAAVRRGDGRQLALGIDHDL